MHSTWTLVDQGAEGLRDTKLTAIAQDVMMPSEQQLAWFVTGMKAAGSKPSSWCDDRTGFHLGYRSPLSMVWLAVSRMTG